MITKNKIRNKRGFVFTLIAILIFSSLFIITASYLKRNLQAQEFISETSHSNRLKFIRENIVNDFYTILDIKLDGIYRGNNNVIIKFSNFSNISENTYYLENLSRYENYIENEYSDIVNNKINITNFIPEFSIYPYNSTFLIDRYMFYLYTKDFDNVVNITIDLYLNESNTTSITTPENRTDGIPFRVRIFNSTRGIIINKTTLMNMSEEGNSYFIEFDGGSKNLTLEFGRHRQIRYFGPDIMTNGTLYVETTNMDAKIGRLWLAMKDVDEKVVLKTKAFLYVE